MSHPGGSLHTLCNGGPYLFGGEGLSTPHRVPQVIFRDDRVAVGRLVSVIAIESDSERPARRKFRAAVRRRSWKNICVAGTRPAMPLSSRFCSSYSSLSAGAPPALAKRNHSPSVRPI